MKTAIILTGAHIPTDKRYYAIKKCFYSAGWQQVIVFKTNPATKSIKYSLNEFLKSIPANSQPLSLFGFSAGAFTALRASAEIFVDNLIIASPSGDFKEFFLLDSMQRMDWTKINSGRIIVGEDELTKWPEYGKWISDLHIATQWPILLVPNTGHEIENSEYQETIFKAIRQLK